ncbi:hypothetical protein DTO006G1_8982 [Penicillium roqueforti]|uniref:uncharacterized protein n=1 Tax=Penicillium roqueforti TaxID=5082 RepID=UPI00190A2208|nr:uncharacterized protein LCP9604111_4287 [Penicillium roqueforti]KAF9249658.1 hypothetical protein LCP9604111_4287 [Penicillium roqueforti]KAI1835201.1 hypothetical protein CBS147337_4018 [Penicillium roqueforti]KAI2677214.1 hypothetical protein CBS147355_5441 [Penicillium roqueforti]KAI2688489.1 hypothetical protein LCP963914a_2891 [Penicillium roqueforti]KAI2700666.1 hypothetical protein CBS147372_5445 [Penicillium roqueforti]
MVHTSRPKRQRPPTIWADEGAICQEDSEPCTNASNTASTTDRAVAATPSIRPNTTKNETQGQLSKAGTMYEDPWNTFEPIAELVLDRSLLLARHKKDKSKLVHIQNVEAKAFANVEFQRMLDEISHSSFLWEHVEVSVGQIVASRLMVTASEIIAIAKPVLEGIQYLANRGRVLATLTLDTVFLTQSGKVRIVGVENSCEIHASEMDAATLKLYALADIVIRLMGKCPLEHKWPVEIDDLPSQLRSRSLGELLQVNLLLL